MFVEASVLTVTWTNKSRRSLDKGVEGDYCA